MTTDSPLQRLVESITPGDEVRLRLKRRIQNSIEPTALKNIVSTVSPSPNTQLSLKNRILASLTGTALQKDLGELVGTVQIPVTSLALLRERILGNLSPIRPSVFQSGFRWATAFAVLFLMVRAMPIVFVTPMTRADIGVQLIPAGQDVSLLIGEEWRTLAQPEVIHGPFTLRTGDATATVLLNTDGVFRIEPNTTFAVQNIATDLLPSATGPTATLVSGKIWILGLLSPLAESLAVDTSHGTVLLNSASVSLQADAKSTTLSVFDRGVTFQSGKQTSFLVAGEKGMIRDSTLFSIFTFPTKEFTQPWVNANLQQDAVHRNSIAKLQDERRDQMASILPRSLLYPAKRIAEEVDVFFTLTQDGRTKKRIQQADTRLSEALALLEEGQTNEASVPLTEYRDSLISMAAGTGDNLVKFLIRKQVANSALSFVPVSASGANAQFLRSAILEVTAAIPDASLPAKDIEGYVLVDRLTEINHLLASAQNLTGALVAYAEVRPYLEPLLQEKDGTHPLLQKEAKSLLVSLSSLLKDQKKKGQSTVIAAVEKDLSQYLPPEPEKVEELEKKLDKQVQDMLTRIFVFSHPRSRSNQLLAEMLAIRGNQYRGTLLRRLYRVLPENGLGEEVLAEIKAFGDELKAK